MEQELEAWLVAGRLEPAVWERRLRRAWARPASVQVRRQRERALESEARFVAGRLEPAVWVRRLRLAWARPASGQVRRQRERALESEARFVAVSYTHLTLPTKRIV